MILKKVIIRVVAAASLTFLSTDTNFSLEARCIEYVSSKNMEHTSQKYIGGKCFNYYANADHQELLIYLPNSAETPNVGTLTTIMVRGKDVEIEKYSVNDSRRGTHPDDIDYELIEEIPISQQEKEILGMLFEAHKKKLDPSQEI